MFTGTQKAAMLIMNLDSATAKELLKGLEAEEIQEIAAELARIKMSGRRDTEEEAKITQEFCDSLQKGQTNIFSMKAFFNETLVDVLDKERAYKIQTQVQMSSDKKDLFADIRMASVDELVMALKGEHPQTIAVVLSEIATSKSQGVLARLSEDARSKTVCRMTNPELVGIGVKHRMAVTVSERLRSFKGETLIEKPEQALRKLALVLSGLEKDIRDQLLDEITKHDDEAATMVKRLMITWSDILSMADRSLQEALRSVEPGKLALALYGADEAIVEKIRSNISERAVAMLDEEISLMQEPLEKEVLEAREEVVAPLREANEEGKLRMVGR